MYVGKALTNIYFYFTGGIIMRGEHTSYYSRTDELSSRAYNLVIGVVLLWGFVINALMCIFCTDFFLKINPIAVITAYLVIAIVGIFTSTFSNNPFISFIGYNLVVLPVGMVLSILLEEYETISILNTCIITAIVTLIMIIIATIFPTIFLSIGKTLFTCLTAVIILEIICALLGIYMPTIWDILVALLFCGYIGYDWAVAQYEEKTLDSAVDTCVGLYLDIINLFIRILAASGNKKSSK